MILLLLCIGRQAVNDVHKSLSNIAFLLITGSYLGMTFARHAGWVPQGWSLMPVVETAWINFLVVVAAILWMKVQNIPLSQLGLGPFKPSRTLFMWVLGTMAIDTVAIGAATPILTGLFEETQQVARFAELPGNLPLLLMLLPVMWLFAAVGEEIFFRGILMTGIAKILGGSQAAWVSAVVVQAIAFGLIHAYQGPVQAITIGIGGAVYGAVFLMAGRNLWPLILAHGINDTIGLTLLYSGTLQR